MENELWVGLHRLSTRKVSITYPEALDEALVVGWIDGVHQGVYTIRFTPRKPETRERRLTKLIEESAASRRLCMMTNKKSR